MAGRRRLGLGVAHQARAQPPAGIARMHEDGANLRRVRRQAERLLQLCVAAAGSLLRQLGVRQELRPAAAADDARTEEDTSKLQSIMRLSYAVFCLKKKTH